MSSEPSLCHIETLKNPARYTSQQIRFACEVAAQLNRGKLILTEEPQQ